MSNKRPNIVVKYLLESDIKSIEEYFENVEQNERITILKMCLPNTIDRSFNPSYLLIDYILSNYQSYTDSLISTLANDNTIDKLLYIY